MLLECNINTDLEITSIMDLKKLKPLIENGLKVNKSRLARELNVDRRTINKYIDGYTKPSNRNKKSIIDDYYDIIVLLLKDKRKTFEYKRVLWQYLHNNYDLCCSQSTFRHYISKHHEFQSYFDSNQNTSVKASAASRFETSPGEQAQLDWKESIEMVLSNGEVITVNVFVLILSYSRYRVDCQYLFGQILRESSIFNRAHVV